MSTELKKSIKSFSIFHRPILITRQDNREGFRQSGSPEYYHTPLGSSTYKSSKIGIKCYGQLSPPHSQYDGHRRLHIKVNFAISTKKKEMNF